MQGHCNDDPNQRAVTVMITDACPQCEPDHIDIQALTYEKVGCQDAGACCLPSATFMLPFKWYLQILLSH